MKRCLLLLCVLFALNTHILAQGLLPIRNGAYVVYERIILTYNTDETVTAYIDIGVSENTDQFALVIPMPSLSDNDQNIGLTSFNLLDKATSPVFDTPAIPSCAPTQIPPNNKTDDSGATQTVTPDQDVPAAFNEGIIQRGDEVTQWLKARGVGISADDQALIDTYNAQGDVFLAFTVTNPFFARDVQPISVTFPADNINFPLRLTALTAQKNAPVTLWVFGEAEAVAKNYAQLSLNEADLHGKFNTPNSTNYASLIEQMIAHANGAAFITEYAEPTTNLAEIANPLIQQLASRYSYVTRLTTRISSAQLSDDPIFGFNTALPDISNHHDMSKLNPNVFWECSS